ncbi:hypothetical protein [Francisella halioticida]|uniref:hypothetical protein n=1 Tax=Francisella halioticida TaxID=549298 RepID=UPI001FE3E8C2|nr:hypothetical protein [Francisella halioticida]
MKLPPLIKIPFRAAFAKLETIDIGVDITSAQGQAITRITKLIYPFNPWLC